MLEVVLALICDKNKILLGYRSDQQPYGNLYEFPGGKIEDNESPEAAVIREVEEEVGVTLPVPIDFGKIIFDVSDAAMITDEQISLATTRQHMLIRFHCFYFEADGYQTKIVTSRGQEGQPIEWANRQDLSNYQFPPVNQLIIRRLLLHYHYLITPPLALPIDSKVTETAIAAWLDKVGQQGESKQIKQIYIRPAPTDHIKYVVTRDDCSLSKSIFSPMSKGTLYGLSLATWGRCLIKWIAQADNYVNQVRWVMPFYMLPVLLSDTFDNDKLRMIWGWQVSQQILMQLTETTLTQLEDMLGCPLNLIASCHDEPSIEHANRLNRWMVAATVSPVHPTNSHPDAIPLGWSRVQQLATKSHYPIYALGGVSPADKQTAWHYGCYGVAGISAFLC